MLRIIDCIREMIEAAMQLLPVILLPESRQLAQKLGISRQVSPHVPHLNALVEKWSSETGNSIEGYRVYCKEGRSKLQNIELG